MQNRPNYQDLHTRGKSQGHTHMIRVLHALSIGDTLGLASARASRTLGLPITEPQSYKEARRSPEWPRWQKAMEVEIASHIENGTWVLTKLPNGRKIITGRWVFKIKYGLDGSILKYKARWVVHGYKQIAGIDFTSTCAGVVKPASFRALFALAGARSLYIYQMDVVTAFLYGFLDEAIYVSQPDGFMTDPTLVCELRKALYGLRQSPRVWYGVIQEFLKSLGFTPTAADPSVFVSEDKSTYVCVCVDDILLIGSEEAYLQSLRDRLKKRFKMSDLGPISHYLGMLITRTNGRITLNQSAYLKAILNRFRMSDCKTSPTPMDSGFANVAMPSDDAYTADTDTIYWYASVIGSLMYAMTMTRPDLGYALSVLSRYCSNPDSTHIRAATRVLRYVKGTLHYGIHYEGKESLIGYTDADFAGAIDGRRSTGGYIYFLSGGPISWSSKRRDLVTQSTCEAEYVAAAEAGKEAVWLRSLLIQLHAAPRISVPLYGDNQGAIALASNPEHHRRTKHIDVRYHWIREAVDSGLITLDYVPTADMPADGLTKALVPVKFERFLGMIGMLH